MTLLVLLSDRLRDLCSMVGLMAVAVRVMPDAVLVSVGWEPRHEMWVLLRVVGLVIRKISSGENCVLMNWHHCDVVKFIKSVVKLWVVFNIAVSLPVDDSLGWVDLLGDRVVDWVVMHDVVMDRGFVHCWAVIDGSGDEIVLSVFLRHVVPSGTVSV